MRSAKMSLLPAGRTERDLEAPQQEDRGQQDTASDAGKSTGSVTRRRVCHAVAPMSAGLLECPIHVPG